MEVVPSRGQRFTLTEVACPWLRDALSWLDLFPMFAVTGKPLEADPHGNFGRAFRLCRHFSFGEGHASELPLLFDLADGPIDIATAKKIPSSDEAEGSRKSNDRLLNAICAHRQSELLRRVGMAGLRGSRPSRCRSTCAGNFHAHALAILTLVTPMWILGAVC